ncbi:MAG: hypothetical protein LBC78_01440, partial [Oscillospiraceae bacterium]|nr:hypothetical protein [Oscillospiraceae bacterium]
ALIKPIRAFDYGSFKEYFNELRSDGEEFSDPLRETDKNLSRIIIEEKYAAYILDKGAALGIADLEVSVTARCSADGYWLPDRAYITTGADSAKRGKLSFEIESGLGLAPEELIWGERNER